MNLPKSYSWSPIGKPPGSLGETLRSLMDGLGTNFNYVQSSISQIIAYLGDIDSRIPKDVSVQVYQLGLAQAALLARDTVAVSLTAAAGGSTWALAGLAGYPNIRAVIVDPNGESNTLTLPTLGANDRLCVSIKCLANFGTLTINGGAAQIVTKSGGSTNYGIPYAIVADGTTFTTYGATLIWSGTAWQIIDNAILVQ